MCYIVIPFEQALTIYRFDSLVIILLVFVSAHGNEMLDGFLTNSVELIILNKSPFMILAFLWWDHLRSKYPFGDPYTPVWILNCTQDLSMCRVWTNVIYVIYVKFKQYKYLFFCSSKDRSTQAVSENVNTCYTWNCLHFAHMCSTYTRARHVRVVSDVIICLPYI